MRKYVAIPLDDDTINGMINVGWVSFKNGQLYLNEKGDKYLKEQYKRLKHGENIHKHGKQTDKKPRKDK